MRFEEAVRHRAPSTSAVAEVERLFILLSDESFREMVIRGVQKG